MLAHHPTTGEPIRILRTDAQISSDMKTLVWLRSGFQESHRWKRWHSVISEPSALSLCDGNIVAVVLQDTTHIEEWISVFPKIFHSESETLLVAPNIVLEALDERGYTVDRALSWEDLYDNYPYLGEPVAHVDPIEKVLVSIAHIFRMTKLVWTSPSVHDDLPVPVQIQCDAWRNACGGILVTVPENSDDSIVPRTWLIQQYFRHPNTRRSREIFTCLEKNIACEYIDNILLLNEEEYSELPESPKIHTSLLPHRLTYYDVFQAVREKVPSGAYVLFSNSDIWFNHTLKHIWNIGLYERRLFLALLRWEDSHEGPPIIYGPRADSQDAWIVSRDALLDNIPEKDVGFPFGKAGCDNAIALIMLRKRFLVCNPAYSIHTMHIHNSNIRNYDPKDILYRPHYLHIEPTAIQPMKIIKDITDRGALPPAVATGWSSQILGQSFPRPILGVRDEDVSTICAALRSKKQMYHSNEQNLYTPPPVCAPLYNFKGGCFVSADGLLSSFKEIYVGKYALWERGWTSSQQSTLMPSLHVPHMIACPYDPSWNESLGLWALYYLPRVLAIRKIIEQAGLPAPEFLVPQLRDIGSFLTDCVWNTERTHITVTPMIQDMNYYSECVWAMPPTETHMSVTAEDVALLRQLMPAATTKTENPIAVFCVEDNPHAVCTRGWAEETADKIMPKGWTIRYIGENDLPSVRRKALQNASWMFGSGSALDWMWYMPKGASVMEFMSPSNCNDTHIHLAGASGLHYVVGCVKEVHVIEQRQNALLDVGRAIKSHGFKEMLNVVHNLFKDKPRIVMPTGKGLEGIYNHSGNGFREMVDLWAERGYVNVAHTEDTHYIWWGGIGDVLLYDRESPRWWFSIPSYQMAMFGNCKPPGPDKHRLRQSTWSFWPTSPRAVETIAARVENMRGYDSRPISSLFMGRVENGLQKTGRCGKDWASAVELFSMPIDSFGEPYPYTQEEYLKKLCSARFGLSLPGNGQLCHREIEYFACGCVPIVTDGIDMSGFLIAPIEGIHYFRASTPEDVRRIVNTTPADKWTAMSAAGRNWWRNYASAEGLFRLTWARIEQCKPYYNVGIPQNFHLL